MVDKILKASGIKYSRARFMKPPAGTYAVYMDDVETDGPDIMGPGAPITERHTCTVELYEPTPDDKAEADMEAAITAAGLPYAKQDRYWLQDVQRYQIVYDFEYITKRRI